MEDIKQLKSELRALVASSRVKVTLATLLRDYRKMMGSPLPVHKYGYADPLKFLKERCGDCFLFQGCGTNTVIYLIVPECLKHIARQHVQNPKLEAETCLKGVQELAAPDLKPKRTRNISLVPHSNINYGQPNAKRGVHEYNNFRKMRWQPCETQEFPDDNSDKSLLKDSKKGGEPSKKPTKSGNSKEENEAKRRREVYKRLLKQVQDELLELIRSSHGEVLFTDISKLYRERYGRELKYWFGYTSLAGLVYSVPGVVITRDSACRLWATQRTPPTHPSSPPTPPSFAPTSPSSAPTPPSSAPTLNAADDLYVCEDALPGIDYDHDVFPEDCMSLGDSIPSVRLAQEDIHVGDMVELMVGEVYSPSHFWVYRLGERYNIALDDIMDDMNVYYKKEGKDRWLALGAVRVGYYCSSLYANDWHRSLIVRIVDSEYVKVLHIDFGTVDRVLVSGLKPLLRRWAHLPAQAIRARLAGVRPSGEARLWSHAASVFFLQILYDRRLLGNVIGLDLAENILELYLVDKSTEQDVQLHRELIRTGHADLRLDPFSPTTMETFVYPQFDALEAGATPNISEIHKYLNSGIALESVNEYIRHVEPALTPPVVPSPRPDPEELPQEAPSAPSAPRPD